jgi:hypothetical protein
MYLFVHIPKTAGTSFRKAAEEAFGAKNTVLDYGLKSNETHPLVQNYEYQKHDRFELYKKLQEKPNTILAGHFHLQKYFPIFDIQNIISFIRKPEEQIRSHYEHFKRHHSYKKTFLEFIQDRRFCNLQSKMLSGSPIGAIGFIGLTERYEESIKLLNRQYGLNIKAISTNKNQNKPKEGYKFTKEELTLIHELNQKDYQIYDRAERIFNLKVLSHQTNNPFIVGEINHVDKGTHTIKGWLCNGSDEQPAEGYIVISEKLKFKLIAHEYRPNKALNELHRKGYIGFKINLPKKLEQNFSVKLYSSNDLLIDEIDV